MLAPYQPAVQAANGYRMRVATEPRLLLRGLRNAQASGEIGRQLLEGMRLVSKILPAW